MTASRRAAAPLARGGVRRWARAESVIVACGVVVGGLILGLSFHSSASSARDLELASRAQQIKVDLMLSHLWLEEYLGGDASINVNKQILAKIDGARERCRDVADARRSVSGANGELPQLMNELCPTLDDFKKLTLVRLNQPARSAIGSSRDQAYDQTFARLLHLATDELRAIEQVLEDGHRSERWRGIGIALATVVAAMGIALMAGRHRRRIATDVQRLAELGAIVSASPDAILSKSPEGVVMTWNPGAERLFGWSAEEIVGRNVSVLVPPECRDQEDSLLARVRAGEEVKTETDRLRKDGSVVPVSLGVSPIFDGDLMTGMASIQRDITERRARDADLAAAREEALEASRLKSEFLATMSHEIRTPMNGVIGLTGLLLRTDLDENQRQYAQGVRSAGESLMTLINEILDLSKIEAGKLELETIDFNLVQVVEEAAELVAAQAQRKGLELLAYCSPELPVGLRGDPSRLRQVLLNLASNAVKFTASGEVVVRAFLEDQTTAGVVVRFEVTDTGIGIAEADRDRLFAPFSQADSSTTREFGGTGLGLVISRRLVTAMGGSLGVESEAGRGSSFWFTVPLALAEDEAVARSVSAGGLTGVRVLIVDDNHTNRLVLSEQLGAWGMRLDVADDGESALRLLEDAAGGKDPYVLAVLDMCMPGMDGLELARRISSNAALSDTELVLLTSAQELRFQEVRDAGISAQLTKPVHLSRLRDVLQDTLGLARQAESDPTPPPEVYPPGSRGHLLVVEDNHINQLVAVGILEQLGYSAEVANNGIEALTALDRTSFAAVLMDCRMPQMDGYTATGIIRSRKGPDRATPIIAMTASAGQDERERCLAAGMVDFISKPVEANALAGVLSRWAPTDGDGGAADTGRTSTRGVLDRRPLETLRALSSDDNSLLDRLVTSFLSSSAKDFERIGTALEARSAVDLAEAAHRLKGGAASLGVPRVAKVCGELELLGNRDNLDPAAEAIDRLSAELDLASSALHALLSSPHHRST